MNCSHVCAKIQFTMSVRYHVIHTQQGSWRVKRTGAERATSVHSTQSAAIGKAKQLAKESSGNVIVHGVDGMIKSTRTYKSDPKPPGKQK